jgi:hypothetical protein
MVKEFTIKVSAYHILWVKNSYFSHNIVYLQLLETRSFDTDVSHNSSVTLVTCPVNIILLTLKYIFFNAGVYFYFVFSMYKWLG